jgi:hypothetical protein
MVGLVVFIVFVVVLVLVARQAVARRRSTAGYEEPGGAARACACRTRVVSCPS